ncbi:MAG: dihydroneopterin aldolase [Candidatus Thermoplasmatota archaeon]|jgi:FolB domain-containing protein|nr:dihydroneopterin aldolase [Candidatus Sysuiplasma jiujiangense]MBX8639453.1 dihydroneopterin aldolase [Candidatus Sysuiplasma jiujiangense]MBX8642595.1 dihydroneopterin aldolase [Candidatus Sysuiplasma jiujiangense]MCL4317661.1 dihydroneopterin aldolase [Candidatus Thermoplasmatota archaeon]
MTDQINFSDDTGKIVISELRLRCIIGINEHERRMKQDVLINIEMWSDFSAAIRTDSIENAVDYKSVTKEIIEKVESSKFFLVESLASMVASICLSHERVLRAVVSVDKPGALRFTRSVGVVLSRTKNG